MTHFFRLVRFHEHQYVLLSTFFIRFFVSVSGEDSAGVGMVRNVLATFCPLVVLPDKLHVTSCECERVWGTRKEERFRELFCSLLDHVLCV